MNDRARIIDLLNAAADRYGVDRRYVHAIARIESGHRHFDSRGNVLRSTAGALGVMQLMPTTARGLNVNPLILEDNIEGGVRYFRQRLDLSGGDVPTAIAMYYAGIGNVRERGALQWEGVQRYIRNFQALVNNEDILTMTGQDRPAPAPATPAAPSAPIPAVVQGVGGGVWTLATFVVVVIIILILGGS